MAIIRVVEPGLPVSGDDERIVDVGPRVEERADDVELALADREQQRRPAAGRSGRDVGAVLDERLHDRDVPFAGRPHESGLAARAFPGVDVGAARDQHAFTTPAIPVRAAVISAVSPSDIVVFGSAPASSSVSTSAALPLTHAIERGVTL